MAKPDKDNVYKLLHGFLADGRRDDSGREVHHALPEQPQLAPGAIRTSRQSR